MAGRVISTVITIFLTVYLVCIVISFFLQEIIRQNIEEINYNVVEVAGTSGVFSKALYDHLCDSVVRFGNYRIRLKLEKYIKQDIYDTYYAEEQIIDKPLRTGDRITVYLEDRDDSLFGRLVNMAVLGHIPDKLVDARIKSIKSTVVSRSAKNVVKGYDAIADLQQRAPEGLVSFLVITGLNRQGKYYGSNLYEYTNEQNPFYGDSEDEKGNTGINYIFDNGDFIKYVEYYPGGGEKLVTYVQQ